MEVVGGRLIHPKGQAHNSFLLSFCNAAHHPYSKGLFHSLSRLPQAFTLYRILFKVRMHSIISALNQRRRVDLGHRQQPFQDDPRDSIARSMARLWPFSASSNSDEDLNEQTQQQHAVFFMTDANTYDGNGNSSSSSSMEDDSTLPISNNNRTTYNYNLDDLSQGSSSSTDFFAQSL